MGNFLDTPITDKETEVGADEKLQYGLSAMQGWRAQMEDDHVQLLTLPGVRFRCCWSRRVASRAALPIACLAACCHEGIRLS